MVCLGNICRSPLAHGILQEKAPEDWHIDSAGTSGFHEGELPDTRSVVTAKKHGIDITYQRSRPFAAQDFQDFDLIYVMDASNYNNVLKLATNAADESKVKLIMNEVFPGENRKVPDPYYGGDSGFEQVYGMLEDAVDAILNKYA